MRYLIVIEETQTGFCAYCPDLGGCVAAATTKEEVEQIMREAIEFHIEGLKQEGYEVPGSHSHAAYCEVTV
ncbi:MAG: type II toxin-antitoxin system HicB family antitoxin [Candidatus Magnetobacterium sp. LHC-1]